MGVPLENNTKKSINRSGWSMGQITSPAVSIQRADGVLLFRVLPKSMSSIAAALFGLGLAVANILASAVVSIIDDITSKGGNDSWVSTNINKGRIDNYYRVLSTMSFINLFYYFLCSWAYGPSGRQVTKDKSLPGR
ncbi:hypothetical protein F3Y22_tig00000145pilonHSYRG00005 [Hibiscus syriacus]|uniref:Uncharacterized protein n=1 Tax=Hibiscus syriacus TaxID=106335 RepID=A0A6A3D9Y2_HIBSY|nr:hypothetical protein F3Y22_tig00000145pilonHSYRG00005 [Hibiscus syriacus]